MKTSQHRLLMFLACLVSVTSSAHVTWQPSKWLSDNEPQIDTLQLTEIVKNIIATDKQEMNTALEIMKNDFKLEISSLKSEMTNKIATINDTTDFMKHVFQFISVNAKTLEQSILNINDDLKKQNTTLLNIVNKFVHVDLLHQNISDKHEHFENIHTQIKTETNLKQEEILQNLTYFTEKLNDIDIFHKTITDKLKQFDNIQVKIQSSFDSQHQQLLNNIKNVTETQNLKFLNLQNVLESFKNDTDRNFKIRKQDTTSTLDKIKQDINGLTSKTANIDTSIVNYKQDMASTLNKVKQDITNLKTTSSNLDTSIVNYKQETTSSLNKIKGDINGQTTKISTIDTSIVKLHPVKINGVSIKTFMELDMVLLGSTYYHFSTKMETWTDAQKKCRSLGLELVSLETEEESRLVGEYWHNIKDKVYLPWLGGTDVDTEGSWKWSGTGRAVTYTNWLPVRTNGGEANYPNMQPNGGTNQNCMYMCGTLEVYKGKWCDWSCTGTGIGYICEAKV